MIARIHGLLTGIVDSTAYVSVGGLTYAVMTTPTSEHELTTKGMVGREVTFHTLHYIEGGIGMGNLIPRLVGFLTEDDLAFFQLLTGVQGLGVKKALRAFIIPVADIARAIALKDQKSLQKLPDIGAKTAQKIILELSEKVARFGASSSGEPGFTPDRGQSLPEFQSEAVEILMQLQYNEGDARDTVRRAAAASPDITTADRLIQEIFRKRVR